MASMTLFVENEKADAAVCGTTAASGAASMVAYVVASATMCTTTMIASVALMGAPIVVLAPLGAWRAWKIAKKNRQQKKLLAIQ